MQELSPKQVTEFLARPRKRSKYNARRVWLDGIWFDSKIEAGRYVMLKWLERDGVISGLRIHPRYQLSKSVSYVADFEYVHKVNGKVVEDAKGFRTTAYRIKKNLMFDTLGIIVFETTLDSNVADTLIAGYAGQTQKG